MSASDSGMTYAQKMMQILEAQQAADLALESKSIPKVMHKALRAGLKLELEAMNPKRQKTLPAAAAALTAAAGAAAAAANGEEDESNDLEHDVSKHVKVPWPCGILQACKEAESYTTFEAGRDAMEAAWNNNTLFPGQESSAAFATSRSHNPKGSGVTKRGYLDWEFTDGSGLRYA